MTDTSPKRLREFFDYGKHEIQGWQQAGDIHGKYFACWFRPPFYNIVGGFVDGERYHLKRPSLIYGTYRTPEEAAAAFAKLDAEEKI